MRPQWWPCREGNLSRLFTSPFLKGDMGGMNQHKDLISTGAAN